MRGFFQPSRTRGVKVEQPVPRGDCVCNMLITKRLRSILSVLFPLAALSAHAVSAIDPAGLFADQGPFFQRPLEPSPGEEVRVRFVARPGNGEGVFLCVRPGGGAVAEYAMARAAGPVRDVWEASFKVGSVSLEYYFRVADGAQNVYYNAFGASSTPPTSLNFRVVPGFGTPGWAKGLVWYQVFPDRFADGDPSNNVRTGEYDYYGPVQVRAWGDSPSGSNDFFGGDLEGVSARMESHVQRALGAEGLYFNPLFLSPSNHKYDTQDYNQVDPHFGGDGALASLMAMALSDGDFGGDYRVRVMLDGVFNHCGDWHFWFNRAHKWPGGQGAYETRSSPYYSFFTFASWPNQYATFGASFGARYDSMPKLDYADTGLRQAVYGGGDSAAIRWLMAPYHADGWRLDVGQEVGRNGTTDGNHEIWADFRRSVKAASPDALVLGEYWGVAEPWLRGDQWDSAMNYNGFTTPLSLWLLKSDLSGNQSSIDTAGFHAWMQGTLADNATQVRLALMNSLSTHDITRVRRRAGGSSALVKTAVAFQFTYPGAPCVYYGDEAFVDGGADPDNRRTFPWGELDLAERADMLSFHRAMAGLRRAMPCLKTGSYCELLADEAEGAFAFARFDDEGAAVTLVRRKGTALSDFSLPVWALGIGDGAVFTDPLTGARVEVVGGRLPVAGVEGESFRVLVLSGERGSSFRVSVSPDRQSVWKVASPGGGLVTGWAALAPDDPADAGSISVAQSFLYSNGVAETTETVLYPAPPMLKFRALATFRRGTLNSGVVLTNFGPAAAQVALKLVTETGATFTGAVPLAPGQSLPRFLDELFDGIPDALDGLLDVQSDVPLAPVQLSVRTNSRGEFLLSALPVIPVLAAESGGTLILNYLAVGGGFSAEIRATSPGAKFSVGGTLSFFDSSGKPMEVEIVRQ